LHSDLHLLAYAAYFATRCVSGNDRRRDDQNFDAAEHNSKYACYDNKHTPGVAQQLPVIYLIGGTPVVGGTVGSISGVEGLGFSTGVGFGSTL
jgi:hypothetical protein